MRRPTQKLIKLVGFIATGRERAKSGPVAYRGILFRNSAKRLCLHVKNAEEPNPHTKTGCSTRTRDANPGSDR